MRAVIYARYSCERQNEMSIEGQMDVCLKYAEEHGLVIIDKYVDRAISGRTDDRPQFQTMIKDSASKTFDVVLVYKLDRFSRDKYQSAIYRNELKKNGVSIMSAMENIPNTPEGVLLESVLEGLNQYYSMELSQKIKRTLKLKKERGEFLGGFRPYGYDIVDGKLVINQEESKTIKQMYALIINGLEPIDIRHKLAYDGSIQSIIRNERYKGRYSPRIVSDDTWTLANDILDQLSGTHANHTRYKFNYKLSGKCFCGICGHRMTGGVAKGGLYRYYECKQKCGLHRVDCEWLEDNVIKAVMDLITDKENLDAIAKECVFQIKERLKKEYDTNSLKKRIDEINKKRDALIELYISTKSPFINAKLLALDEEQEKLEKELYATNNVRATIPNVIQFIRQFQQCPPESLKDRICREIVRKVIVYNDYVEVIIGDLVDGDDDRIKVRVSKNASHQDLEIRTNQIRIRISRK